MRRLVAFDLVAGGTFVDAMRSCFDAGDAVLPLDQRLPPAARRRLVEALRPAAVLGSDGEERALRGALPVEEGDALVMATSGTTGTPKGVVLTHAAVAASAEATSAYLGVDPSTDRWLCCLPLAHVGGLSVVTRALHTGTALEVLAGFDAEAVLAARRRGATLVSLVPTTLRRLGGEGAAAFRRIVLGGSAPPEELAPNCVATYGMTETGSGVVYDGLPLGGVEVRIGEGGEVMLRCPMLLRAYRDGTDPRDANGWLPTGDAGELGADGRLVVHGRLSDLVVSGGENVWPVEVETLLGRHPGVAEVAVAGVADPEWGERLVAYVVPAPGLPVPALAELRALVRDELGPWAAPKELVVVDALPRTAIGKIRRAELAGGGRHRAGAAR
ncbi:MAG TPA: fatty acid--CoA ligase family protein [Acidimicrobiales bacterium]|nr:fatty acid--CoA ligase family protein [Acidimicrobiales bacterium]